MSSRGIKMKKNGISAVIGTTIALAIVFTILIPLVIYLQSLQAVFMQEANRRLQYELERIHEKLEVHLSISPPDVNKRNYFYVILYNPGVLTVSIPTIYIESKYQGIKPVSQQLLLAPGNRTIIRIEELVISSGEQKNDVVRAKAVTLRGNNFVSKELLGPKNLPYYLIVILSNTTIGHEYKIVVEKSEEYGYGCVLKNIVAGGPEEKECESSGEAIITSQSFSNNTESIAVFKVAPGAYKIFVEETQVSTYVEVYDDMIVNIILPKVEFPNPAPLRVDLLHKNLTVIVRGLPASTSITIPYAISLGNNTEPMQNIEVEIIYNGQSIKHTITRLFPGETYFNNFTVPIALAEDATGLIIPYRIVINKAAGKTSSITYSTQEIADYKIEKPVDEGEILVCVTKTQTILTPSEDEPAIEITYVECPRI